MNRAKIGANSLIGAGSLVTEGKEFPPGSLIMGTPARVKRALTDEEIASMCTFPADDTCAKAAKCWSRECWSTPPPTWTCTGERRAKPFPAHEEGLPKGSPSRFAKLKSRQALATVSG